MMVPPTIQELPGLLDKYPVEHMHFIYFRLPKHVRDELRPYYKHRIFRHVKRNYYE